VKWQADSFEELGEKVEVDVREFCTTMEYNETTETVDFDPTRLDRLSIGTGLKVTRTNWPLPLDKPPYMVYGVTCGVVLLSYRVFRFHSTSSPATGITFTYAGPKTDTSAHVPNNEGLHMLGLWTVGEISGGVFCLQLSTRCWLPEGRIAVQATAKRA
jgi:tricarballylate dehydrogenase